MNNFLIGFEKQASLKKDVSLKEHQKRTIRRTKTSPGVLAFHGLGSGKSLTSIAATSGEDTDVVVPAALRENYKKEVKKFTTKHKPNIMSYEGFLKKESPAAKNLVIDEAHLAGRIDSKRARDLIEKAPEYQKRILLSGTPIRNHPVELSPLIRILRADKEAPTDKKEFTKRFIEETTKRPGFFGKLLGRTPSTTYSIKNKEKFRKLISGYVDYHAGATEDFPEVSSETINVEQTPDQRKMYNFVMGKASPAMKYKIKKGLPPSKQESKQLNAFLGAVRQVSNSTRSYGGKDEPKLDAAVSEIKNRMAKDKNFKALVYSNFLASGIDPIAEKLDSEGISYGRFVGGLSDKKRKAIIDDYNTGKTKTLLVSGSGSQGLDLKGTKLIQVLEPHWNSSRIDQVKGRGIRYKSHAHLPKNERKVHVQNFQSVLKPGLIEKMRKKKSLGVDEYLNLMSKSKDDLNNQFLDILKEEGAIEKVAFWSGFEKMRKWLKPAKKEVEGKLEPEQNTTKKTPTYFYSKKHNPQYVKTLNKSIKKNFKGDESSVSIDYIKADGKKVTRKITPYTSKNGNIIIGYDHHRDAVRSFRLDRIQSMN